MNISPTTWKLLIVPATALLALGAFRVLAQDRVTGNFTEDIQLVFPDKFEERVCERGAFEKALNECAKSAESGKKKHYLFWNDGSKFEKLKGGVDDIVTADVSGASPTPSGPVSDRAIHVAQRAAFETMAKLESFASQTKPMSTLAPAPSKP